MKDIFLCHSKKDRDKIIELHTKLEDFGYDSWLDENDILPGQKWKVVIKKAINISRVVLICLSDSWVNNRSYAQKELRQALEIAEEYPDDHIYIIPARLDECCIPESLADIQYVDLFERDGFFKLHQSLKKLKSSEHSSNKGVKDEFVEIFSTFNYINYDPWDLGERNDALRILNDHYVKGETLDRSYDLVKQNEWVKILKLWVPVIENEFFTLNHSYWADKDYYKSYIFDAKLDIWLSYVQLGISGSVDGSKDMIEQTGACFKLALVLAKEIVETPPFSILGKSDKRLPTDTAIKLNNDYLDFSSRFCEWLKIFDINTLSTITDTSIDEINKIKEKVDKRLKEIQIILR